MSKNGGGERALSELRGCYAAYAARCTHAGPLPARRRPEHVAATSEGGCASPATAAPPIRACTCLQRATARATRCEQASRPLQPRCEAQDQNLTGKGALIVVVPHKLGLGHARLGVGVHHLQPPARGEGEACKWAPPAWPVPRAARGSLRTLMKTCSSVMPFTLATATSPSTNCKKVMRLHPLETRMKITSTCASQHAEGRAQHNCASTARG